MDRDMRAFVEDRNKQALGLLPQDLKEALSATLRLASAAQVHACFRSIDSLHLCPRHAQEATRKVLRVKGLLCHHRPTYSFLTLSLTLLLFCSLLSLSQFSSNDMSCGEKSIPSCNTDDHRDDNQR
jgi:hypothetical protein